MKIRLLLVIDMQNDFITGALGNDECRAVVPKVIARMEQARKDGWKIICTQDIHEDNYLETGEGRRLPVEHCLRGTNGAELIDEIEEFMTRYDDHHELFLSESPFEKSAFGSTDLSNALKKYDIEEIELIGVCTDICVISNAMILRSDYPEIEVSVNQQCCAGVSPESHKNALMAMQGCQINIKKGDDEDDFNQWRAS